jgi:hypothetical protein
MLIQLLIEWVYFSRISLETPAASGDPRPTTGNLESLTKQAACRDERSALARGKQNAACCRLLSETAALQVTILGERDN